MNTHLLLIDYQNDFVNKNGSLFVPGADLDIARIRCFIQSFSKKINAIHVSLDSHHPIHIAHPIMHINDKGEHPAPFTVITKEDYKNGKWRCSNSQWQEEIIAYLTALENNGRYFLQIWPPHCLLGFTKKLDDGTEFCGHAIPSIISDVLNSWEENNFTTVNYILKGKNIFTESYSIYRADVIDPFDESTMPNRKLLSTLRRADEIIVAGEALNFCVANSVIDICKDIGDENIKKFVLLRDCCSNVPGFENLGNDFINKMLAKGMRVVNSVDYVG